MGCKQPIDPSTLPFNITNVSIQSITVTCDYGEPININALKKTTPNHYEPEMFPSLRLTCFNPICVNVFSSGKKFFFYIISKRLIEMELYIDGCVANIGGDFLVSLSPASKCALMFSKYPNRLTNIKIFVVLSDSEYDLLNPDQIDYYHNKSKDANYDLELVKHSNIPVDYRVVDRPVCVARHNLIIYCGPAAVYRSLVQFHYKSDEKISVFGKLICDYLCINL